MWEDGDDRWGFISFLRMCFIFTLRLKLWVVVKFFPYVLGVGHHRITFKTTKGSEQVLKGPTSLNEEWKYIK